MKQVLSQLGLLALLLCACSDVGVGDVLDEEAPALDGGVEIDSVEQESCAAPCRKVPHKIYMTADLIPGWGPAGSGGGANTGEYASGIGVGGGGRMTYTMNTIRVQWYRSYPGGTCTTSGATVTCGADVITCPHYSQITVHESGFYLYCGDKFNNQNCGSTNYNWFGTNGIDHLWKLATPGAILADAFQSANTIGGPGGSSIPVCNYHVMNGFFWLDIQ